jgi:hypothetical protein
LTLTSPHEQPATVGGPLVVDVPMVTVSATVKSAKPIEVIEWELDDARGWVAGKLDPKTMTDTATVKPFVAGKQRTIRVRARHKGGDFATDAVQVVYHPRPPVAEFTGLPSGVVGSELIVRGAYSQAAGPPEAKVVVVGPRPGQSREFPATATPGADPASGTWRATVTLFPGVNKLGVVAGNQWRTREPTDRPEVVFRRPPVVASVEPVSTTPGGTADVIARVLTHVELDPTGLMINGQAVRAESRKLAAVFGLAWWELKAGGVSVKAGDAIPDEVAVAAVNPDGEGAPVKAVVRKLAPPPKPVLPPTVVLNLGRRDEPGQPIHTTEPRFAFELHVTSGNRLSRVEIRHVRPALPERFEPVAIAAGGLQADAKPRLDLDPGVNHIRVIAANAGGESATELTVSYTPPPVRVVIDRIEEIGPGGKAIPLAVSLDGPVRANGAFLELHGRVVWTREGDPVATDPSLEVVINANQVAHLPVSCAPRAGAAMERAFKAPVFLNAVETAVRVEVRTRGRSAGLPQQGLAAAQFPVGCKDPLAKQRLHVLVIGVETPESGRLPLVREVIGAVGGAIPTGRPGFDRGEFTHRAFVRAVLYRPLVHDVTRGTIIGLLREVEREVQQTAAREGAGWVNDVVLVYYRGRDTVGADRQRRLHTTRSLVYEAPEADRFAIRLDDLPPTPGVRLVVLNVLDPGAPLPAVDTLTDNPPLLRYALPNVVAMTQLLTLFEQAVAEKPTVGGVIERVHDLLGKKIPVVAEPIEQVPPVVRQRRIGTGPP